MDIKEVIKSKRIQIIFLLIGAVGGFLYWRFVGCTSGTCAIKSVWYWTTLWGSAMGYLVGDIVNDLVQKHKKKLGEEK
ncbi:MAG TPA: DUF6132 family protein [Draconibacterium sp.]|nr:DUF6132 family protein [Draconibacterium sp.]